ncbi:TPA: DUF1273 domain-containing protein [Streptococcus suis]
MHTNSLLISGYRHTDLGIFNDKDPRIPIIKTAIKKSMTQYLEDGVEWFIFTGNLGFEFWTLETLRELQSEGYTCKIACIFLFENHGENWNDANQLKLSHFKTADFVKYIYPFYQSPAQFQYYNRFLIDHTDGIYLFYDSDNETNLKYLYHQVLKEEGYTVRELTFDELNEVAENFSDFE